MELKRAFRSFVIAFERLLSAVSEKYGRAAGEFAESSEERRGELIEGPEHAYDFSTWHLGLVAFSPAAHESVRAVAEPLDANLLSVNREPSIH